MRRGFHTTGGTKEEEQEVNSRKILLMVEIAMMAALAYVFSLIQFSGLWGQGGSVSLVMIPIMILAFRRGLVAGLIVGLIVGVLKALLGGFIVHPIQLLLDYPLAYAMVGLAGLFALKPTQSNLRKILFATIGVVLAASVRFLSHFVSGVVWFGEYAPEGTPVPLYSFVYNLSYLGPETVISLIVVLFLVKMSPQLFQGSTAR
jgi:thiamine transporter